MSEILKEAFKALSTLEEDTFSFDNEGVFKLDRFLHYDDIAPDFVEIVDPEAPKEEDLQSQYDGKAVLRCCVCGQLIYKDPAEVIVDDDLSKANVEEECPHCQLSGGFEVVGQVAPYIDKSSVEVTVDDEPMEVVDKAVDTESETGTLAESFKCGQRYQLGDAREYIITDVYNTPGTARADREVCLAELLSDGNLGDEISLKFSELAGGLNRGKYTFLGEDFKLEEDFQKATVESGDTVLCMETSDEGKITVTSEPRKVEESGDEMIIPVTDELQDQIEAPAEDKESAVDEPDIGVEVVPEESANGAEEPVEDSAESDETFLDIEELDTESFNELGESYFRKVYDNIDNFQVIGGSVDGNKLLIEGLIAFTSGKQAKTRFLFEGVAVDRRGRLKFSGENAHLSPKKGAFTLRGIVENNKLITESFTYNYRAMDSKTGKGYSLYGTVRR